MMTLAEVRGLGWDVLSVAKHRVWDIKPPGKWTREDGVIILEYWARQAMRSYGQRSKYDRLLELMANGGEFTIIIGDPDAHS
jgi:hypothetical protein